MEILVLVASLIILLALVSALGGRSPQRLGKKGEKKVIRRLNSKLDPSVYRQFHDLTLPVHGETTQIDHVVLSPYGVFVIETKNYSGWIFGDRRSRMWTQTFRRSKFRFLNPLRQNYKHTKAIEAYLKVPADYVHSVVVFVGDAKFKTDLPANVIYLRELIRYIRAHDEPVFGRAGYQRVARLLEGHKEPESLDGTSAQAPHLRLVPKEPVCHSCGSVMKKRTASKGPTRGSYFWGCSSFPKCRVTRDFAR